jgi:hypothetical protein
MNNPLRLSDDEQASGSSGHRPKAADVKYAVALYVDRTTQQWVVRDPQGSFWLLPAEEDSWQRRRPFQLTEDTDLETVPGHYQYMLNLPF